MNILIEHHGWMLQTLFLSGLVPFLLCFSASSSSENEQETNQQVETEYGDAIGASAFSPTIHETDVPQAVITAVPATVSNVNSGSGGNVNAGSGNTIGTVLNVNTTTSDVYAIQAVEAAAADEGDTAETAIADTSSTAEDELQEAYEAGVSTSYNQLQSGLVTGTGGGWSATTVLLLAAAAGGLWWIFKKG